jgi:hypothetical protein
MDEYHFNTSQNWRKKNQNTLGPYSHEKRKMKRCYYELCGKRISLKENWGRDQSYENEK